MSTVEIADTPLTVFAGDRDDARQVRLVIRRTRPTPRLQLVLLAGWFYHAFVTDRDLPLAEVDHCRYVVLE